MHNMGTPTTGSGTSSVDRIAEAARMALPGRLARGAEYLGQFWREGQRCASGGWSRVCCCGIASRTQFCQAKILWLELLVELGPACLADMTGSEEYFVLEAMDPQAFRASGMTLQVTIPEALGTIRVGPKGTFFKTLLDIAEAGPPGSPARAQAWEAVVKVQEKLR